jgi:hypothetical protein
MIAFLPSKSARPEYQARAMNAKAAVCMGVRIHGHANADKKCRKASCPHKRRLVLRGSRESLPVHYRIGESDYRAFPRNAIISCNCLQYVSGFQADEMRLFVGAPPFVEAVGHD